MKKKFLAMSVVALFGAVGMVSCGGQEAASSSQVAGAGKIVLSTKAPAEIQVNKEVNMEDYVTVTKVDSWSLESDSETISIDGHTIKAIDYGEFTVMVVAGSTKKAYTGTVVSADKIAFNQKVTAITNNYTASAYTFASDASTSYDLPLGINFHNENYFASQGMDSKTYAVTDEWDGYLSAPDDHNYAFEFKGNKDTGAYKSGFEVTPGYQRDMDNYYLGMELSMKNTDFAEILGQDGTPTGIYRMTNRSTSDYGDTLVGDFASSTAGMSSVASLIDTYNATFWAYMGEDDDGNYDGSIVFELLGTSGGQTVALGCAIAVSDIGTTSIAPVEGWLADPTYPNPYDVSKVTTVFNKMNESKNYTVSSRGYWLNVSTGEEASATDATACTSSASGMFFTYDVKTYVTSDKYYSRVDNVADDSAYGSNAWKANETLGAYIKDNKFYSVAGTYADNTTTWGKATESSDIVAEDGETLSIWDSSLGSKYFSAENLAKANWWDHNESTDAGTGVTTDVYYFNELGEDEGSLMIAAMLQIGNSIGGSIASNFTVNYPQYQYNYFSVSSNGSLTFAAFVPWGTVNGSMYYYLMESTFSDIGTTLIPTGANMNSLLA